jgi:KaiC/GvpD/RAD55 family RecA-like ATPase
MLTAEVAELLLSTFRGRHDHIAYQPAGQTFRPLKLNGTVPVDKFIERHTNGNCCGFYLLNEQSRVNCIAIDVDNHTDNRPEAIQEGQKFQQFLLESGFPSYLERSWSGTGVHVWVFFDEPVDGIEARVFASGAVNDFELEAIEIYPRQAKLTTDKPLGNLIRYPLAGKSVFLNPDLTEAEPIAFMNGIQKVTKAQLEAKCWWNTAEQSERSVDSVGAAYETTGMPSRVLALMDVPEGELLLKRWMGDVSGMSGQRSRSDVCFALCTEMIRNYVPTPEVEAALRYWCAQNAYEKGLTRPQWVADTVRYAYGNLKPQGRKDVATSDRLGVLLHSAIESVVSGEDRLITTGIKGLNESLGGGLDRGELVIVAGRPSQGKTMTAWHILDSAAKQGTTCAFLSLEMTENQIMTRHLQRLTDIPKSEWRDPNVAKQLHEIADADIASKAPIYFSRGGKQTLTDVVSEIRHYAEKGATLIAVDYIELILGAGSDFDRVTESIKVLAKLAKEQDIALVVLAQLRRQDPRIRGVVIPQMGDLRTSGMIEQAADTIIACVWPSQVDPDNYTPDVYSLICLKNRNRGILNQQVPVKFIPERQLLVG